MFRQQLFLVYFLLLLIHFKRILANQVLAKYILRFTVSYNFLTDRKDFEKGFIAVVQINERKQKISIKNEDKYKQKKCFGFI